MKKHIWNEYRFHPDGELNGFRCCVQEYRCVNCKVIIEMPTGMSPEDYPYEECRVLEPLPKGKWQHKIKGGR